MSDELNKIEERIRKNQEELQMLKDKKKKALQRKRAIEQKKQQERIRFLGGIVAEKLQSCYPDQNLMEMGEEDLKALVSKIISSYREEAAYGISRE